MNEEDRITSTPNAFSMFIEQLSLEKKMTNWDTILEYCADNFIDTTEIVPNINKSLREKIAIELQADGKLPQSSSSYVC